MAKNKRADGLDKLIAQARKEGIWLTEFPPIPKKRFGWTVAAGCLAYLKKLRLSTKDFDGLTLSDYMAVTVPGWGDTREAAYRMAVAKLKESAIGKKYLKKSGRALRKRSKRTAQRPGTGKKR